MSKACKPYHTPVLLPAVLEYLAIKPDGFYVDCTAGGGGHSAAILQQLGPGGQLLALDRDSEAIEASKQKLESVNGLGKFHLEQVEFSQLANLMRQRSWPKFDGLLADLGVSSAQLDYRERGFSFRENGPLDMRMNQDTGMTAADLVNSFSEEVLKQIFYEFGEERYAARAANAIVTRRKTQAFTETLDLAETIARVMPAQYRRQKNPAKRCFQAIRIVVNQELKELDSLLESLPGLAHSGARVCLISFHSLEDRAVKRAFNNWENPCTCPKDLPCVCGKLPLGKVIKRKGIIADRDELATNSRARSARLRVFEFN